MTKKAFTLCVLFLTSILLASAQTKWYNPLEQSEPVVQGRWWNDELRSNYHRMPDRAKESVRAAVWNLSRQSAGLSIKFHTNAPSVKVRYKVTGGLSMFHMPTRAHGH